MKRGRYRIVNRKRFMAFAVGTSCAALLLALMAILAIFYRDVPADGTPRNEDASAVGMGDVKGRDEIKWVKLTSEQTESVANATASDASTPLNVKTVVSSCLSLVGKVNYFWGGKSTARGWDDNWGTMRTVAHSGSETTGETRPFGLDCSGFVTWAFIQLGLGEEQTKDAIGEGTWNQWHKSVPIEWSELKPGDFAFQNEYPGATENHIGICIGRYNNEPVFVHCCYSENNVVVTMASDILRFARRPSIFAEG